MSPKPFTSLALVYDDIMADIEYEDWCAFMLRELHRRGWTGGRMLDLGCGTGNATIPMTERGFDVTGVDASTEMLHVAAAKVSGARFLVGDFETFDAGGPYALAYSVFDSLNNLLEPEAFARMASNVYDHVEPGGFFVFDVNTTRGLRDLWEAGRAEGWAGEVYYNWRHSYDPDTGLARVDAFCLKGTTAFTEVHFERPYDPPELRELLAGAGFEGIEAICYPDGEAAPHNAQRIWMIARRPNGSPAANRAQPPGS